MDPTELDATITPETIEPDAADSPAAGRFPKMTAAEALERLARGETLRDVRIERLRFRGEIAYPVRMVGVRLVRPEFDRAQFAEAVSLRDCLLDKPSSGRRVTFAKGLDLCGSTFGAATLRNLTVHGPARFDRIRTRGRFLLNGCEFHDLVRFWDARVGAWCEFVNCRFAAEADFRSVCVEEGLIFERCRFESDLRLRGATVVKKLDLGSSRFEGLIDLSKAKLHDFVYLEGIEQGEAQRFAFRNALAERLLVRPEQLAGRLACEEAGDYEGARQEYGLLKRAFEAQHRHEAEDWAFYRFKVNQRRCCRRSWRRPWTKVAQGLDWLLLDKGCAYGTDPLRAVAAAGVLILIFAAIYAAGITSLNLDHLPFGDDPKTPANRLMVGLTTSVAAFTSGFGDLREAAQGWMCLPLIAESLMGTLLWGLFIVAFSRKVIR